MHDDVTSICPPLTTRALLAGAVLALAAYFAFEFSGPGRWVVGVLLIGFAVRIFRIEVLVAPPVLVIRNPARTYRVPLSDIDRCDIRSLSPSNLRHTWGYQCAVILRSGKAIRVDATSQTVKKEEFRSLAKSFANALDVPLTAR